MASPPTLAVESAEELLELLGVEYDDDVLAGRRLVLLRAFARRRAEIDRTEADEGRRWGRYGAALREEYQRCVVNGGPSTTGPGACAACAAACAVAAVRHA